MANLQLLLLSAFLGAGLPSGAASLNIQATNGTAKQPHVVLIAAEDEYKSEESLPLVAKDLRKRGVRCTILTAKPTQSNPKNIPGLEALATADAAVFYMRFRELPDHQLKMILDYVNAGKPVVGIRTATHSFRYPKESPNAKWNDGFGQDILGAPWRYHYGHESSSEVAILAKQKQHPILEGVDLSFHCRSWLYHVLPIAADAQILMTGKSVGPSSTPMEKRVENPVAWTRMHNGGRVFYTSIGHPEDFEIPSYRKMLVNAVFWVMNKPVTPERPTVKSRMLEKFELRDGDRVVLVGSSYFERDRHFGAIETMLRLRFPGVKFSLRNLTWPGDTTTIQLRPANYGSLEERIREQNPTVALLNYGNNEAFDGPAGLPSFLKGYRQILDTLEGLNIDAVLLSPAPHERKPPMLPDAAGYNSNAAKYASAIEKLAKSRGLRYANVFDGLLVQMTTSNGSGLTDNGVHFNQAGSHCLAEALAESLQLSHLNSLANPAAARSGNAARLERLEDAVQSTVVRKDQLFFSRYRAHNGEYIYGSRARPGNGNAGNPSFPNEFAAVDRMLREFDAKLAELTSVLCKK